MSLSIFLNCLCILPINTINHRTILPPDKKSHKEKNHSLNGNIHVKAELLNSMVARHKKLYFANGVTLTINE